MWNCNYFQSFSLQCKQIERTNVELLLLPVLFFAVQTNIAVNVELKLIKVIFYSVQTNEEGKNETVTTLSHVLYCANQ